MRFPAIHPRRVPRSFALLGGCLVLAEAIGCSSEAPTAPASDTAGGSGGAGQSGAGKGSAGSASPATGGTSGASSGGAGGSGGTVASGGAGLGGSGGSSAGAGARGGTAGSNGGSGGAGGSGIGGAGGVPSTGGSAGAAGGLGGQAGGNAGTAGAGAVSGSGGSGGNSGSPDPSEGCGQGGRPAGGKAEVANTSLYLFPADYDGTTPYPLLIALHACGNPNTEFVSHTNGTAFETGYVRMFPNTPDSGQCWSNYNGNVARVTAQYDEVMSKYCIDRNRVFATGHSSGSQLLVNILSHASDAEHLNLKGIAPIAADPYNVAAPMPILYIHGQMDNQRSADSAPNTMARFRTANSCAATSKPYTAVMQCNSTESGRPLVDPGCISYDDCSVPTIWCSHNDPSYSGTQHGIPCFAMKAMVDFFAGL